MQIQTSVLQSLARVATSDADIEYYCRRCRGHFTRTVPVRALASATCRCGSRDLLIYQLTAEASAPLL